MSSGRRKIYSDAGNLKHSFLLVKPELLWYDTGNRKGYLLAAAYNKGGESVGSKRYGNNKIYEAE